MDAEEEVEAILSDDHDEKQVEDKDGEVVQAMKRRKIDESVE